MRFGLYLQAGRWAEAEPFLTRAIALGGDLGITFAQNGTSAAIAYPITEKLTAHIGPDRQATRLLFAELARNKASTQGRSNIWRTS